MGCGVKPASPPPAATSPASDATVAQVCATTAVMFDVKPGQVKPETSLADLEADQLDYVELVMTLEEKFNVMIDDEVIEDVTGTSDWQQGMKNLTMAKLASAIEQQQAQSGENANAEPSKK
ncbi:hypothetical protein C5Y96_23785 [Blastopirellula marina]|uniref:Carrier domain-containing protein n=2 Tax=Pirellulales TaxID=2691354 RepID=A0A2S8F0A7_9BACT|nr:hypothetical protein C5Y96_23785 [Blastopirellula marina]RCS42550.1 acyl carrier protein [Bremerella cremea]